MEHELNKRLKSSILEQRSGVTRVKYSFHIGNRLLLSPSIVNEYVTRILCRSYSVNEYVTRILCRSYEKWTHTNSYHARYMKSLYWCRVSYPKSFSIKPLGHCGPNKRAARTACIFSFKNSSIDVNSEHLSLVQVWSVAPDLFKFTAKGVKTGSNMPRNPIK